MKPFEFHTSRTIDLHDFETIKPANELFTSSCVATLHSAANMVIDSINVDGTINAGVYQFLGQQNARRAAYEPFLGGDLLADVAIYYDKESLYDPTENGVRVEDAKGRSPHLPGVLGAARILREAHVPYGLVTQVNLDTLGRYRAVIVSSDLEMTREQAAQFRAFVEKGGVLLASGPSSLDRFDPAGPRFLLEDVLGVRYKGNLGTAWTYFTSQDDELKKTIWPQAAVSFPGSMIDAEALSGSDVLATGTLPFVDPKEGNCLNVRFAQIWNNPPALTPGSAPGIVVHSFGQGKAIWTAAPIEAGEYAVNAKVVCHLLRRFLPAPYHFEVDTHSSVEMTLYHQPEKRRLLVTLLNMDWQLVPLKLDATVRVHVPAGHSASTVLSLPERKALTFKRAGDYVEFRVEPFDTITMAAVDYA